MLRVLVVDDHPAMRVGVRRILNRNAPDVVVEEASGGEEAVERARTESWSLILLDLSLPGRSGFETLGELRRRHPDLPVLVFSVHTDETFVVRALKGGASGYLTKDCSPEELVKAVRKVAAGGRYVAAQLSELLIDRLLVPDNHPLHEELSSREYEVMLLLSRGDHLRDIARQLCISESTVSTYRTRILGKLRLDNNAQVTRYAIDHNLL